MEPPQIKTSKDVKAVKDLFLKEFKKGLLIDSIDFTPSSNKFEFIVYTEGGNSYEGELTAELKEETSGDYDNDTGLTVPHYDSKLDITDFEITAVYDFEGNQIPAPGRVPGPVVNYYVYKIINEFLDNYIFERKNFYYDDSL